MSFKIRHALLAAGLGVALSGCGSGSNDDPVTPAPDAVTKTTDIPDSAQANVAGFLAYVNSLITGSTNDTGAPILVGNATVPTSDTTEAAP